MLYDNSGLKRELRTVSNEVDYVVVGGGLAGVCNAITAARQGLKVVLVQDRPVLGGNASSEVRLWVLGATSHMGNNNRWAREGGVIDELLLENMYRNKEGNPLILDTILLEKVILETNITLLLNTAVYEVEKSGEDVIEAVVAFCSQNATRYQIKAPLFCDASGDGIVGFLAGAAFRMGAESSEEFGELFAPDKEYGELLGHSIYFYTKDVGYPVSFTPPAFALDDITKVPRYKNFNTADFGCRLWWIEYGGRLDTVHETETIKWELWKVIYGVWNHIKNSGKFPEAETMTLEWVGTIPGKRESRRFEGDYMLIQQDIVEQREHKDAIGFGGWSIDLHPADGVFSEKPGCNQWHSKGVYQIPYRCLYSRNIANLFLGGRIISASHVAFGSSRVMATCASLGQATGMAAALAKKYSLHPKALLQPPYLNELQTTLTRSGHFIPGIVPGDENDLVGHANITASSALSLTELPGNGNWFPLSISAAQMIPLKKGEIDEIIIPVACISETVLEVELRVSSKCNNHTPDTVLETWKFPLKAGTHWIPLLSNIRVTETCYGFLIFKQNNAVSIQQSDGRISGLLSVFNTENKAVSNNGKQTPPQNIGMESFEFWVPKRRPEGQNFALKFPKGLSAFSAEHVRNGIARPTNAPNAWVAEQNDGKPTLTLQWESVKAISTIILSFDADFDHPMESALMIHPENIMPFCVRNYQIYKGDGTLLYEKNGNHQTLNTISFDNPVYTDCLKIALQHPSSKVPAALFEIKCY